MGDLKTISKNDEQRVDAIKLSLPNSVDVVCVFVFGLLLWGENRLKIGLYLAKILKFEK